MVIYLLLVNIAVCISYIIYFFTLRKLTFFQWNRLYLLGSVLFALLIPIGLFIDISSYFDDKIYIPTVNMVEMIDISVVVNQSQGSSIYLYDVLKWIYFIGLSLSIVLMFWKLWQVRQLFQSQASYLGFSFFNKMFLGKDIKQYKNIEIHEKIHIEQGHSYDNVFMELFKALNWFNPLVYTMSKEIKFQHECIADELSSEDKVAYAELLVAHAMKVPHNVLVHEFSNQSFLKKRIMMLFKNKSSKNKRFLYLGIIPAVLVVGLSTIIFNTSRAKNVVAKVESKIEDVKLPTQNDIVSKNNTDLNSEFSPETLKQDTIREGGDELFTETEINPEPPGGMNAFRKWIGDNYQYPQAAIDAGVKGTVKVTFIVEKDGSLSEIKVKEDLGHGTAESAVNVLKKSPKWSPAIQNGRKVRYAMELPIRLDLSDGGDNLQGHALKEEVLKSNPDANSENMVFQTTEIIAEPPGGLNAFRKWIGDNYQYPQAAIDAEVKGTVLVSFIVEKDGTLSFIESKSDLGYGTGEAAVNVLKKSPKWMPARQIGRPVRLAFALPIRLNLTKM